MSASLCVVGPLPPPRHGVSAVNEALLHAAHQSGVTSVHFNTAPESLDRSLRVRLGRLSRIAEALAGVGRWARATRGCVYFSLSGGLGLLWEALLVWRARVCGARIVVHHHSFRYLDERYAPMDWLVQVAGSSTLHVVLGRTMAERLRCRYPAVKSVLVLSNAAFVSDAGERRRSTSSGKLRIGMLSNLSAAKGLDDFLDLAGACRARGLPFEFVLAGPFESGDEAARVSGKLAALAHVDCLGPVYGEAKQALLSELDVFVFPTRYRNEAEPLVILEAMSHGCPVIAFGRGCIPEMLAGGGGVAVPHGGDFVSCAIAQLVRWRGQPGECEEARRLARRRFLELREQGMRARRQLLESFKAPGHE